MLNCRIAIVGTSGSGKTTLARQISQRLAIPHVELDALHWEPNWTEAPIDVFRSRVEKALSGDAWVVDGNYSKIRPVVWSRADTIVWLDYPFSVVMRRILQRTIRRVVLQEDCCNGNRETFQKAFLSRDSIIVWVVKTYQKNRRQYSTLFQQPEFAHLKKVRLTSSKMVQRWLEEVSQQHKIEN
ncbi:MAG: adenylate kinase [Phormidesmis sp. CAN_BIN36]|nr:adenylate kinase [Phormidesmis sp. CAN_BIN36]